MPNKIDEIYGMQKVLLDQSNQILEILKPTPADQPEGYPAIFINAKNRQVLVKKKPGEKLKPVIEKEEEYFFFLHVLDLLQQGVDLTNWLWGFVIWNRPQNQWEDMKKFFDDTGSRIRKKIQKQWRAGSFIGIGYDGFYNLNVQPAYFYTNADNEDDSYPVWDLLSLNKEVYCQKNKLIKLALLEESCRKFPDNLHASIGYCQLLKDTWLTLITDHRKYLDLHLLSPELRSDFRKNGILLSNKAIVINITDDQIFKGWDIYDKHNFRIKDEIDELTVKYYSQDNPTALKAMQLIQKHLEMYHKAIKEILKFHPLNKFEEMYHDSIKEVVSNRIQLMEKLV